MSTRSARGLTRTTDRPAFQPTCPSSKPCAPDDPIRLIPALSLRYQHPTKQGPVHPLANLSRTERCLGNVSFRVVSIVFGTADALEQISSDALSSSIRPQRRGIN